MKATTTILAILALAVGTTDVRAETTLFGDRERNSTTTTNRPRYTRPAQQQNNEGDGEDGQKESPLRKEFNNIRELQKVAYEKAMERKNKADAAAIEGLKRRVGVKDIDFAKRCDEAIEAVNKSGTFHAIPPSKDARKRDPKEIDLWSIKESRGEVIKSISKQVFGRAKPHYQTLKKKAFNAKDYDLAKEIEEILKSDGRDDSTFYGYIPFLGSYKFSGESFRIYKDEDDDNVYHQWTYGTSRRKSNIKVIGREIIILESGWSLELSADGKSLVEKTVTPGKKWLKIN